MPDGACPEQERLLPLVAEDAEHAERDVVDHVANCSICRRRLQQLELEMSTLRGFSAQNLADTPFDLPASPVGQPSDKLPATIGRYRVAGRIGRGGQGLVYRVVHPTLHNDLVLKLSRRPLDASGLDRDRLSAEGRLLAELDHPNLARVYDLDVADDRPFLVLEYVRGRTLRQYVHDERPSPRQAALLLADVARALVPAHAAGVIHQDLKPANILIDEQGRPRIIDFGMALLRGAWTDETAELDSIGGTLSYMAPEQARGEFERLGPACDIFALGAVLYEMLVGSPPFCGENSAAVLARARNCEFDRAKLRAPGVPRRLARVCLRAMSPDPQDRHAAAQQLAEDLDRCGRRRTWWPAAVSLAAAALVAGGLAAALWPGPQETTEFQYLVRANRDGRLVQVYETLPLETDDRIRVFCSVPAQLEASLFWYDSSGVLRQQNPVEMRQTASGDVVQLVYPGDGRSAPLIGSTGTEFVLVCAQRGKPPEEKEVRRASAEFLSSGSLPALPEETLVLLNRDAVEARSSPPGKSPRSIGAPAKSAIAEVEDRLERLRLKLRSNYPFVVGVAFPHARRHESLRVR